MSAAPEARALLAAVLAAPEDDAPRAVYADWLIQRGEPRGELIACQLAAARGDAAAAARARALLTVHGAAWSAELGDVDPSGVVFERGFVAACRARAEALERLAPSPAWSTVTRLEVDAAAWGDAARLAAALERTGLAATLEQLSASFEEDPELEEEVTPWLDLLGRGEGRLESLCLSCPRGTLQLTARPGAPRRGELRSAPPSPGSWADLTEDPLERALQAALATSAQSG